MLGVEGVVLKTMSTPRPYFVLSVVDRLIDCLNSGEYKSKFAVYWWCRPKCHIHALD